MDPNALRNVTQNVILSTALGAAYGATYGLVKRSSSILFAGTTASSTFLASALFFGVREYVVSPALVDNIQGGQFAERRAELRGEPFERRSAQSELNDIRIHKIPDSAAAGALTGGALNTLRRGPSGILPGAVTVALAASIVQYAYNEARLARIRYVSHELQSGRPVEAKPSRTFQERILDGLGYMAPIRRMSDEEFVKRTERRRAEVDARLNAIETELEDIEAMDRTER